MDTDHSSWVATLRHRSTWQRASVRVAALASALSHSLRPARVAAAVRAWPPQRIGRTVRTWVAAVPPTLTDPRHGGHADGMAEGRLAALPEARLTVMTIRQVLARALVYWRPYWGVGLVVLGLMAIQEFFSTFYDLSLGRITDQVLIDRNGPLLLQIMAQLGGLYAIAAIATVVGDYLTARIGARILNDLRRQMFTQLQRLSMRYFAHAQAGDVVARFTSDLAEIDKGLTVRFTDGNLALIGLMINVPTLFIVQWRLALITLAITPIVMLGPRLFAPRASRAVLRLKREQAALASAVQENVRGQAVVKAFGLQSNFLGRLGTQLEDLFLRTVNATFTSQLVGTTSSLGVRLASLLIIGTGAFFAFQGLMSIGALVAYVLLLIDVTGDAYSLSKKVVPSLIGAGGGIQRIDEVLHEAPDVTDAPGATALPRLAREIRFQDVSFSYDREHPTLEHVNLTIPAGRYVAFVGPTGAGKSTILNLIMRFYDVSAGAVTFDDHDVRQVTQESLRDQIGVVFQDVVLFNTSIRENIRLGRVDATDAEVEEAARAAELHEAIQGLPHGYDTTTGEMGGLLSGGQRQRLAIARAILRDPAVLILDEPTSDLDPVTEAAIMATLERLAGNRTLIAVTHRLSSVQRADRVFVLEGGQLIEQGPHQEMLDLSGLYYQLWQKQHGFEISPDGQRATVAVERLRALPLFTDLDGTLLESIARHFRSEHYDEGATILRAGRPGDTFYVLVRGKVEVVTHSLEDGERQVVVLEDGDYFGESALHDDALRPVTIRALRPSLCLSLRRDQFLALTNAAPALRSTVESVARNRRLRLLAG